MSLHTLYRYNLDGENEVDANQHGRVTPTQFDAFDVSSKGIVGGRGVINMIAIALFFFVLPVVLLWLFRESVGYGLKLYIAIVGIITYLIEIPFLWFYIRNMIIHWEMRSGRITQAQGEIVWRRNRYVADAEGRRLQPLLGDVSLIPGEYRFYFLPTSGRLLSVERTTSNIQLLRDALAQTNNFLTSALEANRKGLLATSQILRLLGMIATNLFWSIFILIIFIGIGFAAYTYLPVFGFSRWYALIALGIGGLIALGFMTQGVTLLADLANGKASVADGKIAKTVQTTHSRHGTRHDYFYEVLYAHLKFEVSEAAHEALVDDLEYRLYYTPRTKIMVAIEPK
ncbi:MAG: hypothetical protein HZB52_16310 [Chloroflexi bacterium]|nr:hypothetical protein [Chloroflexota bacterium]